MQTRRWFAKKNAAAAAVAPAAAKPEAAIKEAAAAKRPGRGCGWRGDWRSGAYLWDDGGGASADKLITAHRTAPRKAHTDTRHAHTGEDRGFTRARLHQHPYTPVHIAVQAGAVQQRHEGEAAAEVQLGHHQVHVPLVGEVGEAGVGRRRNLVQLVERGGAVHTPHRHGVHQISQLPIIPASSAHAGKHNTQTYT
jgi:hypothetical protein